MRNINDILKLFSNKCNMDYCDIFDDVKGVLEYCNENITPLSKIQYRGGHEKTIEEIVKRIQNQLLRKTFINDKKECNPQFDHELRKLSLFLVLNTDVTYKYNLKEDQNICHIMEVLPQLPKCLLVHLIWGLQLDKYFYEMLSYSPCWFSFQFIEPAIASLKYLKPYDVVEKVENIVKSIYRNISRSDLLTHLDVTDKKRILQKLYDNTTELLRQFYTPDSEKFSNWEKIQLYKYSGFAIMHLLDMVLFCFDHYEERDQTEPEEYLNIYSICAEACPINVAKMKSGYSELICENLLKITTALLNSLQYNVMLVTVKVFISWVEFDITDELTLQSAVGERAYKVIERMANNKSFEHDVQEQLKFFAIQPKTVEERVKDASIGEILRKLDDESLQLTEKRLWFNALINKPVIFGNDECLETIRENLQLLSLENFFLIIDYLKIDIDNFEENSNLITILVQSLRNFNADQLLELNLYKVKTFGIDNRLFEQANLSERSIEFFNKLIDDFDLKEFLELCFENPRWLFAQYLTAACNSEKQIKSFCSTLLTTRKLSKLIFDELLNNLLTTKYKEKYYSNVIYELYQSDMIDKASFFEKYLYVNVVEYLNTMNLEALLPLLQAMVLIANKTQNGFNSTKCAAPALVLVGQILEKCRWDMISYSDLKEEIVKLCIEFIRYTSKKFLPVASEIDKKWITEKVSDFRPINRFYFLKYSLQVSDKPKSFHEYLHPTNFENTSDIEKFLISTFIRCTTKETEWLARCDCFLPHISTVVFTIEGIAKEIGDDAVNNLRHCLINYVNIIKKFLIPSMENDHRKVKELSFKILRIVETCPLSIYEEIFMTFHTVLLEVFQQAKPMNDDVVKEINKFVASMKDCKGKEIFNEKFKAIAIERLN